MESFKNRLACVLGILLPLAFVLAAIAAPVALSQTSIAFHVFPAATSQPPCDHPVRLEPTNVYDVTTQYDSAGGFSLAAESTVVNEGASPVTGYTWNQVLQARYGVANVEWVAPKIPSTPLTLGVLRMPAGDFDLASGWNGYGGLMTEGAPDFNIVTRTHVEGQAAALMQRQGINEGILYMNNPEMCRSCVRFLPRMLQPGRSLQIVFPDGSSTWIQGSTR